MLQLHFMRTGAASGIRQEADIKIIINLRERETAET